MEISKKAILYIIIIIIIIVVVVVVVVVGGNGVGLDIKCVQRFDVEVSSN